MMNIVDILHSSQPGNALKKQPKLWPLYLDLGAKISAGPAPFHHGTVLDHLCRCMNDCAGDPLAVWMALTHDAGKCTTPLAMLPHHYGHELRGEILARIWAKQLKLNDIYAEAGENAALLHMRAGRYLKMRPGKQYTLLNIVNHLPYAQAFWKVVDADSRSSLSLLSFHDWQLLQNAKKAGLSEQKQIQELAMHGVSAMIKRTIKTNQKSAQSKNLIKNSETKAEKEN